jgi:hypothetical protein
LTVRTARPEDGPEVVRLASIMYRAMGLDPSERGWQERALDMFAKGSTAEDRTVFVVEDDTHPAHQAILAWLRERAVTAVELHATPSREALYRKYGFIDPTYPQLVLRMDES